MKVITIIIVLVVLVIFILGINSPEFKNYYNNIYYSKMGRIIEKKFRQNVIPGVEIPEERGDAKVSCELGNPNPERCVFLRGNISGPNDSFEGKYYMIDCYYGCPK